MNVLRWLGGGTRRASLRRQLLAGILLPVLALVLINTASLYRQALKAADTAYDRTLLASAKSLGESLSVRGSGAAAQLDAQLSYAALEAFEADNRSRMYYRISGFDGAVVSGYADLPAWRGKLPDRGPYAALVDFYDDRFRGERVRVAVLLQPVAGAAGLGMATIQVAETLELRETLARQVLLDTLWRQAALLLLIGVIVITVVQRALRPVNALSAGLRRRAEADLSPIEAPAAPRELLPLVDATNDVMSRLAHLLADQKRFVRDASHQLRTPLAVLKTQVQSALRGDVDARQALVEIEGTVDRANDLARQMLALAKVEQLRHQGDAPVADWSTSVRDVALDLSALIADKRLDFELSVVRASVRAHPWALRELTRNLLHNAIRHTPPGGTLQVQLEVIEGTAHLRVHDSGPGLDPAQRARLFQPFSSGGLRDGGDGPQGGSGLGLAICHEIVVSLGGRIALDDVAPAGAASGLVARVMLPIVENGGHERPT